MNKPVIPMKHGQDKEESWRRLYPTDKIRQPDERVAVTVERKLYPRDHFRHPEEPKWNSAGKLLYPRTKFRSSYTEAGQPTERVLWTKAKE